ncbi:MAG: tetratricopeptide repeat protein [Phycisphaerae bacterium]|nr:tetratricopeptide repeat protein [Phycisphaerae bacterium]
MLMTMFVIVWSFASVFAGGGVAGGGEGTFQLARQMLAEYRWREVVDLVEREDRRTANLEWALGQAYAGLDENDKAIEHYRAATGLNRADTRSMSALARLFERMGQPLAARAQYEALLEVDALAQDAREAVVKLLIVQGRFEEAEAQIVRLRRMAASGNCLARCSVRMELARGRINLAQARQRLIEAMTRAGADADSLVLVASMDLAREDPDSAEKALAQVLVLATGRVDAEQLLVSVYRNQLRFDEAEARLRALLQRHPNRIEWVENLFNMLVINQNYDAAVELISSFLERRKPRGRALHELRLSLLQALESARRFDEQIATVRGWLAEEQTNRALCAWLITAHLAAGYDDQALSIARGWHLADPGDVQFAGMYGEVLLRARRFVAARQLLLERLEKDAEDEELWFGLIAGLLADKQYDDALEMLESIPSEASPSVAFLRAKLSVYLTSKSYDKAAALANRMLLDKQLMRAQGALNAAVLREGLSGVLITALLKAGRSEEAQVQLTHWIGKTDSTQQKVFYLTLLAGVYQQRGLGTEALESLELAYSLAPGDTQINNDLGYTLADRGERLDEAERMIRIAVAREPMNAAYLDSLGWVLYRQGRFEQARSWLVKAVRCPDAPDDPVLYDHLGDVHWCTGARDQAVEHWKRSLELARERLTDQPDAGDQRIADSVGEKLRAVESGQDPQVAHIAAEKSEKGKPLN